MILLKKLREHYYNIRNIRAVSLFTALIFLYFFANIKIKIYQNTIEILLKIIYNTIKNIERRRDVNCTCITNNNLMKQVNVNIVFVDGSSMDVLLKTRDYIHRGYRLINSPIGASVRMLLSPVKSVIISSEIESQDECSLLQVEAAIEKHQMITANRGVDARHFGDYKQVDYELTTAALNEASRIFGR